MISIIVPVYNVAQYLPQCVESILNQTYRDLEVILVDDGSTDGSDLLCDRFMGNDSRIIVVHKKNGGLTSARNAGLAIAHGDWVMHVDSDDFISQVMIEEMLALANRDHSDVVIGGLQLFWDDRDTVKAISPINWDSDKLDSINRYISSDWTCLCGTMAKRSLYTEHNLKSPDGITWCEDFHLMVRLIYFAKKVSTIDKPYYQYRQRTTSMMNSWSDKMIDSANWVLESVSEFFKLQSENVYLRLRESIAWRLLNIHQNNILCRVEYCRLEDVARKNRSYILTCPYLSWKRKVLYLLHSISLVRLLGIRR